MISPVEELTAPLLRREVTLDEGHGPVTSAELHVSSQGIFEAFVDGVPVGPDVLSPGWSSYEWRLRYRSYDVAELLHATSVLGISLGNGWYRGRLSWNGHRDFYGDRLGVIAQLEVVFADGHRQLVVTDESWSAGPSETLADDLYDGQTIDARRRDDRVAEAGTDPCRVGGRRGPGLRRTAPDAVRRPTRRPARDPTSRRDLDLAVRAHARRLRAEPRRLAAVHACAARPARRSPCGTPRCWRTGSSGSGRCGRRGRPTGSCSAATSTSSSRPRPSTGSATRRSPGGPRSRPASSRPTRWRPWSCTPTCAGPATSRAPTTCSTSCTATWSGGCAATSSTSPATARSATSASAGPATSRSSPRRPRSSTTSAGFLRDWLVDLGLEQRAQDGLVPFVVPDVLKYEEHPTEFPAPETAAIWSDAAVWVPWALWQAYGDPAVLADQYDSMAAHVSRVESLLSPSGLWDTGFQFGDWLDPQAPPDRPFEATRGQRRRGHGLPLPDARGSWRRRPPSRATTRTQSASTRWPTGPARPSRATTSRTTAPSPATRRRSTPSRSSSACSTTTGRRGRGTGSPSSSPRTATTSAPASPGRRSSPTPSPRPGTSTRPTGCLLERDLPLLAVPRHHGRDDHLGTLGLDAPRRQHQPRRDDQLQPLRTRRRRRLDAPHGRRAGPARARLPPGPGRPPPGRRPDLGGRRAWRPCTGWSACGGTSTARSSAWTSQLPADVTGVVSLPGQADTEVTGTARVVAPARGAVSLLGGADA